MQKKTKPLTIYPSDSLYKRIQKLANKEKRKISRFIIEWLDRTTP